VVAKPTDVWRDLTSTVVELMRDLKAEREMRSAEEVADAALSAFADVPGIESYRERLVQFARDISAPLSTIRR